MLRITLFLTFFAFFVTCTEQSPPETSEPLLSSLPNVIIIFADDQGYQDVECFGSPNIKIPYLNQLASEGVKATNFYAAFIVLMKKGSKI